MTTYVLVHGGMHGAWCWERLTPLLRAAGHEVLAPDLPGHGADRTPRSTVTMAHYIERVGQIVTAAAEPVILIGHSMGGMVVSAVADGWPKQIRCLVYISAIVPRDGESMNTASGRADQPNEALESGLTPAEDGASHIISPAAARATFYSDLTEEDADAAFRQLTPQPDAPLVGPVRLTPGRLESVARVYIYCERDRALTPARQQTAINRYPRTRVLSIDSGHSPFLSQPDRLAAHLLAL